MSDPNRPRQSPSGSQHWRQDDPRGPQRDRTSARSDEEYTRPVGRDGGSNTRNPSRDGGPRTRGRDAGRYDDASRQPKRTRGIDREDGWGEGWDDWDRSPRRGADERRTRNVRDDWDDGEARGRRDPRDGSGRSPRDEWGDADPRSPRGRGVATRSSRRDPAGSDGPRGWDDNGWTSEHEGWDDAGWSDPWAPAAVPARAGSHGSARGSARGSGDGWGAGAGGRADDAWQPASRRAPGGQGREGFAARAGAAWKSATSQVAAVVRNPSTFRERLKSDRKTQIIAGVMLFVIVFCMLPTSIVGISTYGLAKGGIAHLKNAENDFKALATSPTNLTLIDNAQSEMQSAHNDFAQLQMRVGLLAPLGAAPKVGSKIEGANKLLPLAVQGTQAGVVACDALKILVTKLKNPLGTSGGLTADDLSRVASDVDQIQSLYNQMEPVLATISYSDLSLDPGLWPTVSSLQTKLPEVNQTIQDLDGMAHALPALLGVGKPSTYLVLVLDSSELRPTGGFIGNFGALTIDSGRLKIGGSDGFHISDITLIDSSVKFPTSGYNSVAVDHPTIPIPPQYQWLDTIFAAGATPGWSVRDSNLDPDYPTTAKNAIRLYNELLPDAQINLNAKGSTLQLYDPAKSGQFAGVVTLSLGFFAEALNTTGSIQVDDGRIHETINAQNFVSKIHYYALSPQFAGPDAVPCGTTSCAKVFTSDVVKAFLDKVKSNLSTYVGKLGKLFYDSLHTKDVEIYLAPTPAQALLHDLKLSAEVQAPKTGDSVFEVDANIGANKDNAFLQYQMSDQIALDDSGAATHKLNWSYHWPNIPGNGPTNPGTNPNIYPNLSFAAGNPDYHSYSRVFTPTSAHFISQTGLSEFNHDTEFNRNVYHGAAYAYFNQTSKYGVSWSVPDAVVHDSAGYHYHLLFQREAGITWPLTLTVTLPKCVTTATQPVVSGLTNQNLVKVAGNVVTITGPLTDDEQFQFDWNC